MRYRELGKTGLELSLLGFGASPLGGVFGPVDETNAIEAVQRALELGVNLFDVSPYYGLTKAETVLGKALRGVPRDRYVLASKVGRYQQASFDFSHKRVISSVDESLERLGVDYLDIVQAHDIEFGSLGQIVQETLPALRQLQRQGKVRFVGVTGLPLEHFDAVLEQSELDTILSYCHYTLWDTSLLELLPLLKEKRVGMINASPLGMGLLTRQGPPDWHPASAEIKQACAEASALCQAQGVDIAKLALQFSVSHTEIDTTLVGMATPEQVETNLRWIQEPLDRALLAQVQVVLEPISNQSWPSGQSA